MESIDKEEIREKLSQLQPDKWEGEVYRFTFDTNDFPVSIKLDFSGGSSLFTYATGTDSVSGSNSVAGGGFISGKAGRSLNLLPHLPVFRF